MLIKLVFLMMMMMSAQEFISDNGVHRNQLQLSNACFCYQQPCASFHFHSCHHFQVLSIFQPCSIYHNALQLIKIQWP